MEERSWSPSLANICMSEELYLTDTTTTTSCPHAPVYCILSHTINIKKSTATKTIFEKKKKKTKFRVWCRGLVDFSFSSCIQVYKFLYFYIFTYFRGITTICLISSYFELLNFFCFVLLL